MITVLTLTSIVAIVTLYVLIVYKKGWLKGELKADKVYYRCPNQECRRVFKEPVWLIDLSQSPPEGYQGCPHCGVNIQYVEKEAIPRSMEAMIESSKPGNQAILPRNEAGTTSWQTPKPVVQNPQIPSDFKPHGVLEKQVEKDPMYFKFVDILHECIFDVLKNVTGEVGMKAILLHIELGHYIKDTGEFHRNMYEMFGDGAIILEKLIAKELFRRLGLSYSEGNDFDFKKCVDEGKELFTS
jgi:hypothetical protein